MKKFNQLAKKLLKFFLSSIKSKVLVAIKVPRKVFFFSAEDGLGTERVNDR